MKKPIKGEHETTPVALGAMDIGGRGLEPITRSDRINQMLWAF